MNPVTEKIKPCVVECNGIRLTIIDGGWNTIITIEAKGIAQEWWWDRHGDFAETHQIQNHDTTGIPVVSLNRYGQRE